MKVLVIGGGSNLLISDDGFDGTAVVIESGHINFGTGRESGRAHVTADAGVAWDALVEATIDAGFGGLECLSGIPGAAGATPVQNVGAYGVEVADIFYFSMAANPAKDRAYGAYNFLSSFDLETGKPIKRVPLPHSYYSVNVSTDGKTVYLGGALSDVAAYDAETLERKGAVEMPDKASISLASVRLFTRAD